MAEVATAIPGSSASSINAAMDGGTATPPLSKLVDDEIRQSREIPTTWRESISAWWASDEADAELSETRLLRRLQFFRSKGQPDVPPTATDPDPITARVAQIPISPSNPKRFLNTLSMVSPSTANSSSAVVLLHGYGAGLAFFYMNWRTIAEASKEVGRRSYCVDWMGMGRSARLNPKELHAGKKATVEQRVYTAENFFIDSLDQWREQMKIEKMTLIGHSLGGYLSVAYALKYPSRVDRLILLSPAGIPDYYDTPDSATSNPSTVNAARELSESQKQTTGGKSPYGSGGSQDVTNQAVAANMPSEKDKKKATTDRKGNPPPRLGRFITYMWEAGYSPLALVKGPWGPSLVGKYASRRFAALPEQDIRDMHSYIWTISRAKGSGEYAITHLLAPGAHARLPIVNRISKVQVPVAFLYGDRDWMDIRGGYEAVKRMKQAGNHGGEVMKIRNAGHHLYLDGVAETNRILQRLIKQTGREERS